MAQRYKQDVLSELPEVDGILGTGSYGDVAAAVTELMEEACGPAIWATFIQPSRAVPGFSRRRLGMHTCASPRAVTTTVLIA